MNERTEMMNGMNVHYVQTDKFKTTTFVLHARAPLYKETAAARALLANILKSGTESHPGRKEIRQFLDDLYGASFQSEVTKKGEEHVMSFRMETAADAFIAEGGSVLNEALTFLTEVMFAPYMPEDNFSQDIFETEKASLLQKIEGIEDDKIRYANVRLLEEMCADEPFGLHPFGGMKQVENLTRDDVLAAYKDMLQSNQFDLYIVGSFHEETAAKHLAANVPAVSEAASAAERPQPVTPASIREVVDEKDVQQAKLHLGFRIPVKVEDELYPAAVIANGIFGGFPHSKLFINVREKASLAYYAASRYEGHKGLVLAMAGVNPSDLQEARNIIEDQLHQLQNGEFSEEDVEQTKLLTMNQLREQADSPRGMSEMLYNGEVAGFKPGFEERIAAFQAVTKEEVTNAANEIELDTVYILKGKEAD
ncbi:putative Zn-dependent peptidase [Salsuginibacillus halophilus]|uniref:Putative Zn-dependent peptidase n=1 Tax=Salsuginibacillus halophilus TaxID=517424 RepID=A0A2P8HYC8_9BACI|nr:pitrilysin family protein [Salsuginibacillus halophilus]PSL51248.1 putative Zn-dependent peptidase [Salsuginibacillus halophilus]